MVNGKNWLVRSIKGVEIGDFQIMNKKPVTMLIYLFDAGKMLAIKMVNTIRPEKSENLPVRKFP